MKRNGGIEMKRIISILLCITILSTSFAFANTSNRGEATVEMYTFNSDLEKNTDVATFDFENVNYEYKFKKINDTQATVELIFNLHDAEDISTGVAKGIVTANVFSNNEIVWEGPLDGYLTVDNIKYTIIAGFSKLDNSNDIRVGVTIKNNKKDLRDGLIYDSVFAFGGEVISQDMLDEWSEKSAVLSSESESANMSRAVGAFYLTDSALAGFDSDEYIPGYGQRARAYFAADSGRLAIGSKSYCSNVNNYYSSLGNAITMVAEHGIRLDPDEDDAATTLTSILGIEKYDFNVLNFNSGYTVLLTALFEDVMAVLDIPASTITAIIGSLYGKTYLAEDETYAEISFSYPSSQMANFDTSNVGTPIVFRIYATNASEGNCKYIYTTNYRYRTLVTPLGSSITTSYYTDAETISRLLNLQLDMGN